MCDISWEGAWGDVCIIYMYMYMYIGLHIEKHNGKTAGLSKLELPGTGMLAWAKMA